MRRFQLTKASPDPGSLGGGVASKVEYQLTGKGRKLKPVLEALHLWATENAL